MIHLQMKFKEISTSKGIHVFLCYLKFGKILTNKMTIYKLGLEEFHT